MDSDDSRELYVDAIPRKAATPLQPAELQGKEGKILKLKG
jgi:hypothetical protein